MPDEFQGFGLYKLDDHRLVLPRGVENYLKWFKTKEKQECLAVPRRHSIVILSPAALTEHREMMALLETDEESRLEDIGSPTHELARAGTLVWSLTIGADRRLLLPLAARSLEIIPAQKQGLVALLAFRQVIEIWHPDYLPVQLQESVERWVELKERALRGLRVPE